MVPVNVVIGDVEVHGAAYARVQAALTTTACVGHLPTSVRQTLLNLVSVVSQTFLFNFCKFTV